MKKVALASFALLVVSLCYARDVEETFLRANNLYQEKKYQEALDLYSSIDKKGCATLYNMGNCAFKLNKHVDALVCWKRACRHSTSRELNELAKNIEVAHEIMGKEPERGSIGNFFHRFSERFSMFFFQLLFLIGWFALFVAIFVLRRYRRGLLVLLLPFNIVLGSFVAVKYRLAKYPVAIVTKKTAKIFSGPDENYHTLGVVPCADELRVIEKKGLWCKVRAQRLVGWVLADTLEVI